MTEYEENEAGIAVPVPKKPNRRYSAMELQDEDRRKWAMDALALLARAMDLKRGTGGIAGIELGPHSPDVEAGRRQAHGALHRHIGELLLGNDYPGWEEWT